MQPTKTPTHFLLVQECLLELHYISAAEKSWQSWCSVSEAQRDDVRAGAAGETLMCPRCIGQTQFWTISALRIFAAAEPPSRLPSSPQHLWLFKYSVFRFQEPSHSYESQIPMILFFAHWTSVVHDLCVWQLLLCESKRTFSMCVFQCLDCWELLYWFNWGPILPWTV